MATTTSWLDEVVRDAGVDALWVHYGMWVDDKIQMGEDDKLPDFAAWQEMERFIEDSL